jgi:hypothetical protein
VQHTPYIHVAVSLDVEDHEGETPQEPATQSGQLKLLPVPRRAGCRVTVDRENRSLQRVYESQRHLDIWTATDEADSPVTSYSFSEAVRPMDCKR